MSMSGACIWCGLDHGKVCPFVKAFEFGVGGVPTEVPGVTVTRVEYMTPNDRHLAQRAATGSDEADYPKLKGL